jgi:transposase
MFRDEMTTFLHEQFGVDVSASSVTRVLQAAGWSRKTNRRAAKQRNQDLQELYLYKMREFQSYHLVFIDESGCDKRIGLRRSGWAPLGITPVQVTGLHREQRYHILPAYTQDGVMLARVYQGYTDSALFEDFVEQLLHHCGRWPEPRSVLVMDNASIHHSEKVEQLCNEAGVKLLYLPPYSPTLNPIRSFLRSSRPTSKVSGTCIVALSNTTSTPS